MYKFHLDCRIGESPFRVLDKQAKIAVIRNERFLCFGVSFEPVDSVHFGGLILFFFFANFTFCFSFSLLLLLGYDCHVTMFFSYYAAFVVQISKFCTLLNWNGCNGFNRSTSQSRTALIFLFPVKRLRCIFLIPNCSTWVRDFVLFCCYSFCELF